DHLGRGLLPREIEEELLDVVDFQRPLVEPVLLQGIFHSETVTIAGSDGPVGLRARGPATRRHAPARAQSRCPRSSARHGGEAPPSLDTARSAPIRSNRRATRART